VETIIIVLCVILMAWGAAGVILSVLRCGYPRIEEVNTFTPTISVKVWKAKDGWRWKAGFLSAKHNYDEVDWKCDSTEAYDTEREAEASMEVFVCRGWEPVKVREVL